jgi:hypothetical protein
MRLRPGTVPADLLSAGEDALRRTPADVVAGIRIESLLRDWIDRAAKLETTEEDAVTDRTIALLDELDAAELLAWTAARVWKRDLPDGREAVAVCLQWLEDHPNLFIAASDHIQAVGLGLDPDLFARDPDLAWTADKFVLLLDELEDVEAYCANTDVPAFAPEALDVLRRLVRPSHRPWLPAVRPAVLAAADTHEEQPRPVLRRWLSPDRRFQACLVLPEWSNDLRDGKPVVLTFFAGDDPARELAGQPVRLAGIAGTIDPDGRVSFVLGDLRAANADPVLQVGPEGTTWPGEE